MVRFLPGMVVVAAAFAFLIPPAHAKDEPALTPAIQPLTERMLALPNPYLAYLDSGRAGFRQEASLPLLYPLPSPPSPQGTGTDLAGLMLRPGMFLGLQVDFVGPAESAETMRRLMDSRRDPTDPAFLSAGIGLRLGF